jgi:hypothetical protein
VVADRLDDALQNALSQQLQELFPEQTPQLKLLDRDAYETIQQLIKAGVLSAKQDTTPRVLYQTAGEAKDDELAKRLADARDRLAQSEHKRRMAKVLADGGFSTEALAPMREAVEQALHALMYWRGYDDETSPALGLVDSTLVQMNLLPADTLPLVTRLREDQAEPDEAHVGKLLKHSDNLLTQAAVALESARISPQG